MNIGGQKQGGAQRYGQVAAMEIRGISRRCVSIFIRYKSCRIAGDEE
jgi:hypothetical protein